MKTFFLLKTSTWYIKYRSLRILLKGATYFSFGLLMMSYACRYFPTDIVPEMGFFGIPFIFIFILSFAFLLIWLFVQKRTFLVLLSLMLLGLPQIIFTFQWSLTHEIPKSNPKYLKVLSFNVNNLAKNNLGKEEVVIRNSVFSYLIREQADILCLQEFSIPNKSALAEINKLKSQLNCPYHFFERDIPSKIKKFEGQIIFSKFPILSRGSLLDSTGEFFSTYNDIRFNNRTIRVYNVHLESYHLTKVEDSLVKNKNFKQYADSTYYFLRKGYLNRAFQVRNLVKKISESPYPIILAGDFNDVPTSNAYFKINRQLNDAFVSSGKGLGTTYNGKYPLLRIDYIFFSNHFKSYNFQTVAVDLSDHFPINCNLELGD